MTISADIQSTSPGVLVELFELDARPIDGIQYFFHNGLNELQTDVVWQGVTYVRFPIEASGFEVRGTGTTPRPKVKVSNVNGILGAVLAANGDLVGSKFTRRRTFLKYLDAVNFTGGLNASADPNSHLPDEVYFVDRKSTENREFIEWELGSILDVSGITLPRRQFIANLCTWRYRVWDPIAGDFDYTDTSECGYTGTAYFDANDQACTAQQDTCSKRLSGCRKRFPGVPMPFGGFPNCGLTEV